MIKNSGTKERLHTLGGLLRSELISVRDENVVIGDVEITTVARYAIIPISLTNPNILAAQKVQLEGEIVRTHSEIRAGLDCLPSRSGTGIRGLPNRVARGS